MWEIPVGAEDVGHITGFCRSPVGYLLENKQKSTWVQPELRMANCVWRKKSEPNSIKSIISLLHL